MRQLKNSFLILLFLLAVYALLRAGFLASNAGFFTDVPRADILLAFLHGLRFDVAALLWLNAPLLVLYTLPFAPLQWRWYRAALASLFLALNIAAVFLNIADYGYYPTVQRRLTYELYTMPMDILRSVPALIAHHIGLFVLFLGFCAGFCWGTLRFLRRIGAGTKAPAKWYLDIPAFLLAIALMAVGIRGGWQLRPIRPTNAFFTAQQATGYLALNTTYTVIRSWTQESLPRYHLLDDATARALMTAMLFAPDETPIDPAYPLMRRTAAPAGGERRNIVIFIMESWSAQSIGALGGGRSVTPFFDSLAARGWLFANFMASGQRSIEAVPAVLASIPSLSNQALIGSKAELHGFRGLGAILREQGYATSFHHGAALGSMGFDAFARIAGFDRYYSKDDVRDLRDDMLDGVWGVYDEPFFTDAARRMSELPRPFCSAIFSLSSHDPFHLPPPLRGWKSTYAGDTEFEMSLRYSDYALQRFFAVARTQPWFANTIFVLTGDHTFYSMRNNLRSAFHVPLWIFDPRDPAPRRVDRIGSQVDVLPTLLQLLRLPCAHASMGASLLDTTKAHYAVVKFGPRFVIFDDSLALVHDLEHTVGLYDMRTDPFAKHDLQSSLPADAARLRDRLSAYLQCSSEWIAADRVWKKGKDG